MPTNDQPPTTNAVDFDAYLALLSKMLRLTRGQQAEITAELRDHLEERFQELLSQGHPRESAIRLALDELGDAAVLAVEFSSPHQARRRRQLMRYSMLSATAIVTTFVMATFYWPAHRDEPNQRAVAQAPKGTADLDVPLTTGLSSVKSSASGDDLRRTLEEKLARRDLVLQFIDTPLKDAMEFLGDSLELDILLDERVLEEQGIDPNIPVQLKVRQGSLSARAALELILGRLSDGLTFSIREGVLFITSPEADYENEVYDCRDLITGVVVQHPGATANLYGPPGMMGGGGGGYGGGGFFQISPEILGGAGGQGGAQAPGGVGGGGDQRPQTATSAAGQALIEVIQQAVDQQSWSSVGGVGTITEYDGLLIVHHSQRTHRKVEELLAKMRKVRATGAARVGDENLPQLPRQKSDPPSVKNEGAANSEDAPGNIPFIYALLELEGVDRRTVKLGNEVWLGRNHPTERDPETGSVKPSHVSLWRFVAPGERPGTFIVEIAGDGAELAKLWKNHQDHLLQAWLKKPAEQFKASESASSKPSPETLTIGAILELDGADPKTVRPGTEVWLGVETPVNRGGKVDWAAIHFAYIKRVQGSGDQPGTLKVLIEGQPAVLAQLQKNAGDAPIKVRLKVPAEVQFRELPTLQTQRPAGESPSRPKVELNVILELSRPTQRLDLIGEEIFLGDWRSKSKKMRVTLAGKVKSLGDYSDDDRTIQAVVEVDEEVYNIAQGYRPDRNSLWRIPFKRFVPNEFRNPVTVD